MPFALEISGWLGPEAGAFLEYLQSICSFPILRFFRALVGVLSAKHNACGWHCVGCGSSATLPSVAGLIAFKTLRMPFFT